MTSATPDDEPKVHRLRRTLATVPILAGLVASLWYCLPDSQIKRSVPKWWVPATEFVGLQQAWGMFAPDPPDLTLDIDAIVIGKDGSRTRVQAPRANSLTGSVLSERYRKWEERIHPVSMSTTWADAARWFASRARDAGVDPKTVQLRRVWTTTALPGGPKPVRRTFVFFEYDVSDGGVSYRDPEITGLATTTTTLQAATSPDGG